MDLKLDSSGDLDITNGEMTLVEGAAAVAQDCRSRLLFFLGEWFLDTRLGVNWFGLALIKNPNQMAVHSMIRAVVLGTPGVKEISAFSASLDSANRVLTVDVIGKLEDLTDFEWHFDEVLLPQFAEGEAA